MTSSVLGNDIKTGQRVELFKLSRLLGLYIIGLQGMGKSGLFEELILQDIKQDIGVCVLDPHGELIDHVIARLPDAKKEEKVICLDLADEEYPFGLNLLECSNPTNDSAIMNPLRKVLHVFEKAFGVSQPTTPRIYDYLFNTVYTLIANPGYTLIDIPLIFDDACRQKLLANVPSTDVLKFWKDVKQLPQQKQDEEAREILRRLNDLSHAPLRNIVGQAHSTVDLPKIMDEGKILLVKLDRRLEQATSLIGSIIVALILNAAYNRPAQRRQFHLYADEFQNFATEDFAVLLEEARKSGIGITMAHQNRAQLELSDRQADKNLKARTLNVGSLVVFRVPTDADVLAGQFDTTPPPAEPRYEPKMVLGGVHTDWERTAMLYENHHQVVPINEVFQKASGRKTINEIHNFLIPPRMAEHPAFRLHTSRPWSQGYFNYVDNIRVNHFPKDPCANCIEGYFIILARRIESKFFPDRLLNTWEYPFTDETMDERYKALWMVEDGDLEQAFTAFHQSYRDYLIEQIPNALITAKAELLPHYKWQIENGGIWNHRVYIPYTPVPDTPILRKCFDPTDKDLAQREIWKMGMVYVNGDKIEEIDGFIHQKLRAFEQAVLYYRAESLRWSEKDPDELLVPSQYFYVQKPGIQLSSDEMKNRIANELRGLSRYIARVKLSDASGSTVEHTLLTIAPARGLHGQALQERILRIQANNRDPNKGGYMRPLKDVEAEITQRQTQCSQQAILPPQPQAPLPGIAARKAAPPCPSCGFSNPHGSRFCNQCGAKI